MQYFLYDQHLGYKSLAALYTMVIEFGSVVGHSIFATYQTTIHSSVEHVVFGNP